MTLDDLRPAIAGASGRRAGAAGDPRLPGPRACRCFRLPGSSRCVRPASRRAPPAEPSSSTAKRFGQPGAVGQRQLGIELEQRLEHEPAARHLRMGKREPLGLQLEVAEQQQVDVERARAVPLPAEHPPLLDLDRLAQVEQLLGLQLRPDPDRRVQEVRLVEDLADGLRLVQGRDRLHLHPVLAKRRDGRAQVGLAIADVRAEAQVADAALTRPRSSSSLVGIGALVDDLDRHLLDRQRQRRLGLGGANAHRLAGEPLHQPLPDHVAEALERLVAALGRPQRDDVADLGVVDRVLEPVGEHRIAVGHVEADVDLEPLADLPLGLGDPVMRVDGEAANLDLDGTTQAQTLAVRLHGPGP